MALNLDTAIRLSAQVQGANNIRGVATNLQQLNATAQLSGRQLDKLYTETQRFAAAAGGSINAIRQQRTALDTLRNAVDPASRRFQVLSQDIANLDAKLKQAESTAAAFSLASALKTAAAGASVSMVSFAGMTASAASVSTALQRMGVSSEQAEKMIQGLQGQMEQTGVSAQKLNLTLNQALASTPEKAARQINTMRQALAQQKAGSDEYLATLVRINEAEAVMQARAGRAGVIAGARAYQGATLTSGYGSEARLPSMPNTMAADMQRVAELTGRIRNLDRATDEYRRSLQELEVVQARLNRQPNRLDVRGALGSAAGAAVMGGGPGAMIGAAGGSLAAAGGPAGLAVAGGLAAAAGLTVQSVANARELEAQSRRLRVMTDDAAALQAQIIGLVREQGHLTSTTEASAAAYEILQAGFSGTDEIVQVLRASTLGAVGGFTEMKVVADALTSVLNGYGMTAADAARVVDQMKAATDDGKISMEQYAQSIGRVIPSAAAAKVSFEEINAAISALTAQGLPAEATFSGLNQILKTISKPTKEASDLAAELGLEFNAQAVAAKGLGGFLADVAAKTGKSSTALNILFSDVDGYKAVVGLLNDNLQRFNKSLDNQAQAMGRAGAAAKIAVDPIKQFDNAWKDLTATLGQSVLPAITEVVKGLTELIQKSAGFDNVSRLQNDLRYALPPDQRERIETEAWKRAAEMAKMRRQLGDPFVVNQLKDQIYADLLRTFGYRSGVIKPPSAALPTRPGAAAESGAAANATAIANSLREGEDEEKKSRDKAAKDQMRLAEVVGDHQRRVNEEIEEERRRSLEQRKRDEIDMADTIHRIKMDQIDQQQQANRKLAEAQMELQVARAPQDQRWTLEFRRQLLGIVADTGDEMLSLERTIADRRQALARAQANVSLAQMQQQARVIRTEMPGSSGAAGGGALAATASGTVGRLLRAAESNLGLFAGQAERCADAMRRLFDVAGIAIGTTKKAWDGLASGGRLASSFFGSDIGQRISRQQDLRPGDLVGFERTYGRWGPGVQTHVGMYAGGGMMFDHSSRGGLVKRPLNTFGGKFMYGVRPYALMAPGAAGQAPASGAQPGGEMVTTLPASQVGLEQARAEATRSQAELAAAMEALKKAQTGLSQLSAVQIETAIVSKVSEINQPLQDMVKASGDRLAFEREYAGLLQRGINPELAREYIEVDQIATRRQEMLQAMALELDGLSKREGLSESQRRIYEDQAKAVRDQLAAQGGQVDLLKQELELRERIARATAIQQDTRVGEGMREGVQQYLESIGTMRQATSQLTSEALGGLSEMLTSLATTGKANYREFAVSVLESTARMIIQQMVMRTLLQAIGAIGGGGTAASFEMPTAGFPTSGFTMPGLSFAGGGYTGDSPRSGGLDGQGGFLAVLHPRETVIDHHRGQVAAAAGPAARELKMPEISFAGGGYTGDGARSGGVDGQGGFLAMLHPRETVIDHHKGQAVAAGPTNVTVIVNAETGERRMQADSQAARRLGDDLANAVDARIVHHKRPGGLLHSGSRR